MKQKNATNSPVKCFLSIILAFGLLSSFGLHTVQIEHTHFVTSSAHSTQEHEQGFATLDTYMHVSDKKIFFFLPIALLTLSFLNRRMRIEELLLFSATRYAKMLCERYSNHYRTFDYIRHFFKKGILHSKVY